MVHPPDLSHCLLGIKDTEVGVMTNTDIVVWPHSRVMEFFRKGWLELAGIGQYAHLWLANMSGMKHEGAWWDPVGDHCPNTKDELKCFLFHKDGRVGHNETYFAEWANKVLIQASIRKKEQHATNGCTC